MIAVVVPTIRPQSFAIFMSKWSKLFSKYRVAVFPVFDGEEVRYTSFREGKLEERIGVPEEYKDVIFNLNDGVRNLGFLEAIKYSFVDVILTLDDDVYPIEGTDPIKDHLDALYESWDIDTQNKTPRKVPISWFTTASEYMRGFPYGVRNEAEVWVSHGVWEGVHDYDGPTQLVNGNKKAVFYKGPIPKGALFPCCGMNLAFRVEATPYMYFAPMGKKLGVQRFADIWMGVRMKRQLDIIDKAVVSGYSTVWHSRASNVFNNLEQEAKGIKWNETWWDRFATSEEDTQHIGYFAMYAEKRQQWHKIVEKILKERAS